MLERNSHLYQVKVFDEKGNLKKIISDIEVLNKFQKNYKLTFGLQKKGTESRKLPPTFLEETE